MRMSVAQALREGGGGGQGAGPGGGQTCVAQVVEEIVEGGKLLLMPGCVWGLAKRKRVSRETEWPVWPGRIFCCERGMIMGKL